ncbi:MAG: acriflavin resistance protein [Firmicutes bacterium]|nr:acriflavin resistance protein [Bacillota bacterium]
MREYTTSTMKEIPLPSGYQVGGAGQTEDMDDSFSSMTIALVLAAAFIFMVLAAQFESYSEPFAIMLALPLAVIGALAGLFLAGSELSLISLIGIMMLMGLVTKNAILLIDFAKQRMQEGTSCNDALVDAARIRLRPILMTSIAMIFGMLPIALSIGPGAEARAPMAHAIIVWINQHSIWWRPCSNFPRYSMYSVPPLPVNKICL